MLLRQLEYIVAVEAERSFMRAADRCCITQSTLSQQIKSLEEHLRIEIFNRQCLPVEPTREGWLIIEKARLIVSAARSLEGFAQQIREERTADGA